jgi:hypothetical protein
MPTIFQHQQKEEREWDHNAIFVSKGNLVWYIHKRVRQMKAKGRNIQRKERRTEIKSGKTVHIIILLKFSFNLIIFSRFLNKNHIPSREINSLGRKSQTYRSHSASANKCCCYQCHYVLFHMHFKKFFDLSVDID